MNCFERCQEGQLPDLLAACFPSGHGCVRLQWLMLSYCKGQQCPVQQKCSAHLMPGLLGREVLAFLNGVV